MSSEVKTRRDEAADEKESFGSVDVDVEAAAVAMACNGSLCWLAPMLILRCCCCCHFGLVIGRR